MLRQKIQNFKFLFYVRLLLNFFIIFEPYYILKHIFKHPDYFIKI